MKQFRSLMAHAPLVFAGASLVPSMGFAQSFEDAEEMDRTRRESPIIVTGATLSSPEGESSLPVTVLGGDDLVRRRQAGLGETLAGLPGVHLDNFGGGASRPVIRGQTVPRIEILSDGANLFDVSSVSPDHAITTEPLLLDGIEVLRGPAAAIYGGNAMNGAVNLIDSKVPKTLPSGGITGATEVRYGTGDEEASLASRITAGLGQFAFHAEGFSRTSDDYAVPDDFGSDELKDSFAEANGYSIGASWIKSKGYIGAAYSRQDSEYGLPGHSHINGVCHTHGTDLHCAAHDEFEDPFGSPDYHTAKINLRADRVDVRADYKDLLPGFEHVRLRGSYTDYKHDEIDGPTLFSHYTNEVWDGRLELTHMPLLGFIGTLGVQYTDGTFSGINVNDLHEGEPSFGFVEPYDYVTENNGVFLTERRSLGPVDIELAVRQDWREVSIPFPPYNITDEMAELFREFEVLMGWEEGSIIAEQYELFAVDNPGAKHNPFSASLGTTWNIGSGYSTSLSLAYTERPPSVRELYAFGNNLATNSYEVGLAKSSSASSSFPDSRTDVLEAAKSVNLTFRKVGGPFEFEVGLFHQDVDDYIFARLIETDSETGVPHNYLLYTAADAAFTGIDGQVTYQLSPESRIMLFGDYVHAEMNSEDDNLPRIPPGRLGARYEWERGPVFTDIEYYRTFEQDTVASYETETDGYNMINASLSYRLEFESDRAVEFFLRGTNLTDELAFVHTSFVKDQSPLRGRNLVLGLRHQF